MLDWCTAAVMTAVWSSPAFFPAIWIGSEQWPSHVRLTWLLWLCFGFVPALQLAVYLHFRSSSGLLQPRPFRDDELALNERAARFQSWLHGSALVVLPALAFLSASDVKADADRLAFLGPTAALSAAEAARRFGELALSLLAMDAYSYWIHRLLHRPVLYAVHKVHHQGTKLVPWLGNWLDFVELATSSAPALLGPIVWWGWRAPFALFWVVLMETHTFYQHGGLREPSLPLLRLIPFSVPPAFHDAHHSVNTGNYGSVFPWWDRLCGTTIRGPASEYRQ